MAMARDKDKGEDTTGAKGEGNNVVSLNPNRRPKPKTKDQLKLTVKQEAYCQLRASGKHATQTAAYRLAYDCRGMAATSIHVEACKLEADPRIARRIEAIKEEKEAYSVLDAEQIRAHVVARLYIESIDTDSPPSARVRAVELLGKLGGVAAFERQAEDSSLPQDADSVAGALKAKLESLMKTGT
jgi:hypothetical protein